LIGIISIWYRNHMAINAIASKHRGMALLGIWVSMHQYINTPIRQCINTPKTPKRNNFKFSNNVYIEYLSRTHTNVYKDNYSPCFGCFINAAVSKGTPRTLSESTHSNDARTDNAGSFRKIWDKPFHHFHCLEVLVFIVHFLFFLWLRVLITIYLITVDVIIILLVIQIDDGVLFILIFGD